MLKRVISNAVQEPLGDGLHLVRGHGSFAIVLAKEVEHGPGSLQLGLVHVEIHPVQGFRFQSHVGGDDVGNGAR
jgi:hypothetical protein